jgi:hypothetical protein
MRHCCTVKTMWTKQVKRERERDVNMPRSSQTYFTNSPLTRRRRRPAFCSFHRDESRGGGGGGGHSADSYSQPSVRMYQDVAAYCLRFQQFVGQFINRHSNLFRLLVKHLHGTWVGGGGKILKLTLRQDCLQRAVTPHVPAIFIPPKRNPSTLYKLTVTELAFFSFLEGGGDFWYKT